MTRCYYLIRREEKPIKKILYVVITMASLIIFSFCNFKLSLYFLKTLEKKDEDNRLKKQIIKIDKETIEEKEDIDFDKLKKVNDEIVGWINIPNTDIDYPITIHDDNEYYLTHSFDKDTSKHGSIFLHTYCKENMNNLKNIFIFGHNMKDGTMFNELKNYVKQDWYDKHKNINLIFEDKQFILEVFSAYSTNDTNSYQYIFDDENDYKDYLDEIISKSKIQVEVLPPKTNEKIFTLYTCSYETKDARYFIHAKIKEVK